ncbi:MAG TPA: hypothetical protein PLV92_23565, partial [Pirellulaceae bacterium]|nr:hypothetical protein [Pirellulaceae bacterium]
LQVLNDRYFVTAGLDRQLKLSRVNDAGIEIVQELKFAGEVRNIAYDPYNGILAVGAGNETSLWRFDLDQPKLTLMNGGGTPLRFTHHVAPVQGVAFSKPAFLFNSQGEYRGDRDLPRTALGDVDRRQLPRYLSDRKLPGSLAGLKLATGGEDRTVLIYGMQQVDQGLPREEQAIAGGMLPIRELSLSPDGRFVALVGQDNIDGEYGGFIDDIDVTGALDDRLGWSFSEVFLHGRREHNAVPQEYLYQVAEIDGESFFYLRNSVNANQPGRLDRSLRFDLPANKREARPGIDVEPITIEARPGGELEIRPRRYLIDADREAFSLQTPLATPFTVKDAQGRVLGTLDRKRVNGTTQPNVLIFRAVDDLDFGLQSVYSAQLPLILRGPDDIDGQTREIEATLTLNVVDYAPLAHDDVVYVYNDSQTEARPLSNDYDFDNDAFSLVALKATPLMYTTTAGAKVQIATATGVAGTNRIQVVSTLTD